MNQDDDTPESSPQTRPDIDRGDGEQPEARDPVVGDGEVASAAAAAGEEGQGNPERGGAEFDDDDASADEFVDEEVETTYVATPSGHRLTRHTVRHTKRRETVEEQTEVTVDYGLPGQDPFQAPASSEHPAPVG